ncbi:hypothetical protein DSECCO2_59360 [anaerobic digester metagenome]
MNILAFICVFFLLVVSVSAETRYDTNSLIFDDIRFRQAVVDRLCDIDEHISMTSLNLTDSDITNLTIQSYFISLVDSESLIRSALYVSQNGEILAAYPESVIMNNNSFSGEIFNHDIRTPRIVGNVSLELYTGDTIPFYRNIFIYPVRTTRGVESLVVLLDTDNLCHQAAKDVGLSPELFSVVLDQEGTVLWCSDYDELNSIPPDDVLTEFPTFREVKALVLYAWSGRTSYDVWNQGFVRNGAWSSVQFYNQILKIFVAV